MLPQLAARIRSEGRANVHLTTQQRDILVALRAGVELTTLTGAREIGVLAISQRGGELERMGLVVRDHPEVVNRHGKPVKVVRLNLTDLGRTINLDPARPEMTATASEAQASYSAPERQEQPCNSGRRVILPEEDLLSVR